MKKSNEPLISVVIPIYNVEDYVSMCVDSVRRQSYENLEILLIDDGSTDRSGEICDEIVKLDKRVKVFHKENGGLSDARNVGISKARGEILALVDGDDKVESEYIRIMYDKMYETGADVVVCGYDEEVPREKNITGRKAALNLLLKQKNYDIVAWNKLYRKELFDNILYPAHEKHEDSLTTYKILAKADKVAYVPEKLYHYVSRGGSIMNEAKINDRLEMRLRAAKEAARYFEGDNDLTQAAEIAILTSHFAFLDAAIRKELPNEIIKREVEWVKENFEKYKHNKYLTEKLAGYILMIRYSNGKIYRLFRKIRHE
ncbi:glycosyltransferase family 2 protein [Candidatus Saccharibacteria bacterium]|nr:glycosyltransferase family 2 protein [Candidatus Saccharibacteria bacterium]